MYWFFLFHCSLMVWFLTIKKKEITFFKWFCQIIDYLSIFYTAYPTFNYEYINYKYYNKKMWILTLYIFHAHLNFDLAHLSVSKIECSRQAPKFAHGLMDFFIANRSINQASVRCIIKLHFWVRFFFVVKRHISGSLDQTGCLFRMKRRQAWLAVFRGGAMATTGEDSELESGWRRKEATEVTKRGQGIWLLLQRERGARRSLLSFAGFPL